MAKVSKRVDLCGFQSLGDEIIVDILSRLPVESIMVCRCVCKGWKSLTNDNYFAKLHLSKSNTNPSSSSLILIETLGYNMKLQDNMKRYLLNIDNRSLNEILVYPHIKDKVCTEKYMPITSHFDGLICFTTGYFLPGSVVIYNPLISGDYVCLPESTRTVNVTLGFDHSINKYKVVNILTGLNRCIIGCDVFTIGKDTSWRSLDFPYSEPTIYYLKGTCHQGSVYWMIHDRRSCILELDLSTEVFSTISFSNSTRSPSCGSWCKVLLHSLGDYLCLTEEESRVIHVWRIVKQNTGSNKVDGYRTMKIELPYTYAILCSLIYLNNNEDSFLLQILGGFKRERDKYGERIRAPGTHFTLYHPWLKKTKNRFTGLVHLQSMFSDASHVYACSFKPSLISIKEAMLNHL